ncbi:MAG: alanine racemase [Patescibacteria group bacterium]
MSNSQLKSWLEISEKAARHNFQTIKTILRPKTKVWVVVKSNAYGHGLVIFSKMADRLGVDGFCVDSVIEGAKLRENGIEKPILVLGPTFPNLLKIAAENKITITISSQDALFEWLKSRHRPDFHLKIDTGMHRQGFYVENLPKAITIIEKFLPAGRQVKLKIKNSLKGTYTHFASAKDINYPTFTELQFKKFQEAIGILERAGFKNLIRHCAATGGCLINKKYHLDAVRMGIGLYGIWPSKELEIQTEKLTFKPVLSWHTLISEVKIAKKGDYIGYDLTERVFKPTNIAVLPVGYWHGFSRALSGIGEVLINGKKARILGRVSMDMIVADVTGIKCKRGDKAVLIGLDLPAAEMAQKIGASPYEIITRINPLIERVNAR